MKVNKAFVLREIYGKHILMPICSNTASNDPILLNDVAACIWNTVNEKSDYSEVISEIVSVFSIDYDSPQLLAVEKFIEQLVSMELIIKN